MKNKEEEVIKDFDDIFKYIGGWGPFQYLITLGFFPFNFFLGYVYLSPILTMFPPPHWCSVPALSHLSREERKELSIPRTETGGYEQCSQYLVDWNLVLNGSSPQDLKNLSTTNWDVGACTDGWEYDTENFHRSIVSDLNWVCEESWIPAFSQSIFFVGAVPGMLFFGWLSDHYGRIPAILSSNLVALVSGIAIPFVTEYIAFCVLRFVMGFSYSSFFNFPYVITIEYVEESKRTLVGNIGLALALTMSGVYQPWLVKALGDWKIFNWLLFAQMALVVFTPVIMPESCRWLLSMGEGEKTVKIMKKIAKMNGKKVPDAIYDSVLSLAEKQKLERANTTPPSYLDLFRTKEMRIITILITILWMLISLEFDCTVRNITNLDFSIYVSFCVSAALEFPADLLSIVGLEWLGRRWSSAISMFAVGLTILPCAWLTDIPMAQAIFAMAGRFFATYAMNTGFQFSVEVLPTTLRGQGMAVVHLMSMVSQVASPLIVYSSALSEKAPWIIISLIAFVASIPGLFLPETAGVNLPDNLESMKTFGKNDRFFWMPLLGADARQDKQKSSNKKEVRAEENLAFSSI